jgi:plastocyanin
MHLSTVARAAWVFAAAPSKAPLYVAGAVLAAWAVVLAAFGATHPEFPRSSGQRGIVILATALLVGGTMTAAVLTAGEENPQAHAAPSGAPPASAPASRTLALAADPAGGLSYDVRNATAAAGNDTIRLVNRSPVPHNVTIARGPKTVAATKTIQGSTTAVTATLDSGKYVFYCSVDEHRQAGMQGTLTVK